MCILLQAPAAIQLIGTEAESAEFVLGKQSFARGQHQSKCRRQVVMAQLLYEHARILLHNDPCPWRLLSHSCGLSSRKSGKNERVCPVAGDEGEEFGFDRGSKRSYELEVGDALGTLRSVFVQQVLTWKPALPPLLALTRSLWPSVCCTVPAPVCSSPSRG